MFSRIQWLFYPKLGHSKIKIFVARRSLPHRGTSLHTLLGDSRRRPPLYALQGPNSTHKVFTSSHWPTGQHLLHDQNHPFWWWDNLTPQTIWHLGQFDTDHARRTIWHLGQFDTTDNLTPRTIWHHHKFYVSTIVWPEIWLEIYWLPLSIFLTGNYPV